MCDGAATAALAERMLKWTYWDFEGGVGGGWGGVTLSDNMMVSAQFHSAQDCN